MKFQHCGQAEPLILHNIRDRGGLNNVKAFWLGDGKAILVVIVFSSVSD